MDDCEPDHEHVINGLTALMAGAAATHEMFLAYVAAGFTEAQALYLVAQLLAAGMRGNSP